MESRGGRVGERESMWKGKDVKDKERGVEREKRKIIKKGGEKGVTNDNNKIIDSNRPSYGV